MKRDTKVRVRVVDLLAAVRAKKAKQDAAFDKARDEYPAKVEAYRAAVTKEIRAAADRIDKGGAVPEWRYNGAGLHFKAEPPVEPVRDASIDRTIRTLEMAADDAIAITADDYARYLA